MNCTRWSSRTWQYLGESYLGIGTKKFHRNLYSTIRISRWMFARSWIFNKSRCMQSLFLLFIVNQFKKNGQPTNTASYIKHCHMCWHLLTFKTHRPIFCPWAHTRVTCVLDLQAAGPLGESTHITGASDILFISVAGGEAMGLGLRGSQEECPCIPYERPISPSTLREVDTNWNLG